MSWMNVKKLHPNAQLPHRAHDTDAGLDLFTIENGCVHVCQDAIVRTGISIAIPDGWVAIVKEKSGRATKDKITIGACVIDSGYRGELLVHVFNNDSKTPFTYSTGEKIAQLVVVPCWTGQPEWVNELEETERGEGRMGSTGNYRHKAECTCKTQKIPGIPNDEPLCPWCQFQHDNLNRAIEDLSHEIEFDDYWERPESKFAAEEFDTVDWELVKRKRIRKNKIETRDDW